MGEEEFRRKQRGILDMIEKARYHLKRAEDRVLARTLHASREEFQGAATAVALAKAQATT